MGVLRLVATVEQLPVKRRLAVPWRRILQRGGMMLLGLSLLVALVIYGVSVYLETHILALSTQTKALTEENQDLHITLDRIRSYRNVASLSQAAQGLQPAKDIVDVAEKPAALQPVPTEPTAHLPVGPYGY